MLLYAGHFFIIFKKEVISMPDFENTLKEKTEYANKVIERYLPTDEGYLSLLYDAMSYSVKAGGKRLRPIIISTIYNMYGGTKTAEDSNFLSEPFMAAMEYLHTYSLVHDDLPAIDNDDYRRGELTTHKKYGEACGILAGDGLLHLSWDTVLKSFDDTEHSDRVITALGLFSKKTGTEGMLGGQSVDVLFTGKSPDAKRLNYIYELKTCALIECSFMLGGILAGADSSEVEKLEVLGHNVGLAFQIQDDILDYTSSFEELGKPVGSDQKNDKTTYATLIGIDKAHEEVERLSHDAIRILNELKAENETEREFMRELIDFLIDRKK